jgi:hypothetical protein
MAAELFALGTAVRYVAYGKGQDVRTWQRDDLDDASAAESDRYEELLVNPTLLTLTRQRGELDCGGLRFVVVAYGSFTQLVLPRGEGSHVSVALELGSDPMSYADRIVAVLDAGGGRA